MTFAANKKVGSRPLELSPNFERRQYKLRYCETQANTGVSVKAPNGFHKREDQDLMIPRFRGTRPPGAKNPIPAAGYFCEGLEVPGRDAAGAAALTGYEVSYSLMIC